ncbi:Samhd1 [Columba guinea]|nr:Samhd1 [Columba guinea]
MGSPAGWRAPPAKRARHESGPAAMGDRCDPRRWDTERLCQHLSQCGLGEPDLLRRFRESGVTGSMLLDLPACALEIARVCRPAETLKVLACLNNLHQQLMDEKKVFNDPIHGHIEIHPLLVRIIDTPQFQRLRYIKQLGGTYFVFPGASHNRFEHSIGSWAIFTHVRWKIYSTRSSGFEMEGRLFTVQHENASVKMFEHLIASNNLEEVMEDYHLVLKEDMIFIKEQIGGPIDETASDNSWPYRGRPKEKGFLYEIVANKKNGIDVDKWDYFARDCHHLGIQNNFDYKRLLKLIRVCETENQKVICTRDKEAENLYDMFNTRHLLHRRAYQHKVGNVIEIMQPIHMSVRAGHGKRITEAFQKADKYWKIEGSGGRLYQISTAMEDMEAYTKLTDNIYLEILHSTSPELEEAREILRKIQRRELYKFLGETRPESKDVSKNNELKESFAKSKPKVNPPDVEIKAEDIIVDVINMDYGMKDQNPIDKVRFFCKGRSYKTITINEDQVSRILPKTFSEQVIRVYCRNQDPDVFLAAKQYFVQWCIDNDFTKPQDGDVVAPHLTPMKRSWNKTRNDEHKTPERSCRQKLSFDK